MFNKPQTEIPADQIAVGDIEKFLVRSSIIGCPYLWKEYEDFISPLTPGEEKGFSLRNLFNQFVGRNRKEEELFKQFVDALKELRERYNSMAYSSSTAESHRSEAVAMARSYCETAEKAGISKDIFPQLQTITENISARDVVSQYVRKSGYGTTS